MLDTQIRLNQVFIGIVDVDNDGHRQYQVIWGGEIMSAHEKLGDAMQAMIKFMSEKINAL